MKTAVIACVLVSVQGQGDYYAPGDVQPAPVTPPAPVYDDKGGVAPPPAPAPVDVYGDKVVDDYDGPAPVDTYDDVDDDDVIPPTPTPVPDGIYYDDDGVDDDDTSDDDDDDDYYDDDDYADDVSGAPVTPAPYDPPSQQKCGELYVNVLVEYFHYILSHIDPEVVKEIVALVHELLQYVTKMDQSAPDSIAKVVDHVKTVGQYAMDNLGDDKTKGYVVDAIQKAQNTYESIYDTSVDQDVMESWKNLWSVCHNGTSPDTPDPAYAEYVDTYYKAYTGYMQGGATDPAYQTGIDHICEADKDDVKTYGQDVKTAVMKLQSQTGDVVHDVVDATVGAAGKVVSGVMGVVAGVVAMLL